MEADYLVVMTTVGSEPDAVKLAESIIQAKLAACVQMQDIRSVYRWAGEVCREHEVLLMMKTATSKFAELEKHIKTNHPYQTPEIVALPFAQASPEYLRWIDASISR